MKYDIETVMGAALSGGVYVGCHLIALFTVSSAYIHILQVKRSWIAWTLPLRDTFR